MQDKLRLNLMVHFTRVETFVTSLRNNLDIWLQNMNLSIWENKLGKQRVLGDDVQNDDDEGHECFGSWSFSQP